ncbi:MAG TPA: glycosyltransferase family 4 protein [Methylomirabilota bacterium]|jgi:glycosyltransferase involved in cell wall biosynthesis
MKITILAFDLSDNATGRADLLARLLAPRYRVAVVGPQFGPRPWAPVTAGAIEYVAVPAHRYPAFVGDIRALLDRIDGDVLYASKPRPTSYGLALLARRRRRRPLVLDIDDWELGFYYRSGAWGRVGRALNLANPNGLTWTWLCERLIPAADALTVASRFLERRFGGTLLPHVRDTDAWNPERYDHVATRAALGFDRSPLVMFLGTPRAYKGVDDLVEAVASLGGGVTLALVGVKPGSDAARRWAARPFVRTLGEVPFDDVPRYLAAADVVVVPQRATTDTVGQVPAKLFDAMALGRPIVATAVSMIPEILGDGGVVVPPGHVGELAKAIHHLVSEPEIAASLGRRARARCVAEYSFTAARARLFPLIDNLVATRA